jgi:polyisoprenyl-teichoic acid--peptidoglycan teichoic acid transferase
VNDPGGSRLARGMGKRFVAAGVIIAALTAVATATAGLLELREYASSLSHGGKRLNLGSEITAAEAGAPQTFLLIGSDARVAERRQGIRGNSDTMILVRLDPTQRANAVLSIPRDLKVTIDLPNGLAKTAKINNAYFEGGPMLAVQTIRRVLHIDINHVINLNFRAFKEAVNRIGCVYVDIDRRYFNANALAYATIDVQPGYQKMCGPKALDYVRFRHDDNDLVRAARQQDFLRQAKDQLGVRRIIEDRKQFVRLFGRYAETDIRGTDELLQIFKLVAFSVGHPIREVHFRTTLGPSYVTSTQRQIDETVNEFLSAQDTPGPRGRVGVGAAAHRRARPSTTSMGLENAKQYGEEQARALAGAVGFPVLYPRLRLAGSTYVDPPRAYGVRDYDGRPHQAYRMVLKQGIGEYYGVQGMTWSDPPILTGARPAPGPGGRRLELVYDGDRLRLVAVRTPSAVYWISNTLLLSLTNRQMLAIAGSLSPSGR